MQRKPTKPPLSSLLCVIAAVDGRAPLQPPNELASLGDYRTRHKLFHTDAALLEMMRRVPIVAIW